jgi:hypothetical protein
MWRLKLLREVIRLTRPLLKRRKAFYNFRRAARCVFHGFWMNARGWPGWCDPTPYMTMPLTLKQRLVVTRYFVWLVAIRVVDGLKHPERYNYWHLLLRGEP